MEVKNTLPDNPGVPINLTDENFEEALKKYNVIVVDFWASWCMPCKMIAPVVENLAKKLQGKVVFGKVNVDECSSIPAKFNIMSIPTLIVFKNGSAADTFIGAMPEHVLEEKILAVIGD